MANEVTCKYCRKKVNKKDAYVLRPRMNFCNEQCYHAWLDTEEGQEDAFLDYIWNLYDVEYRTSSLYIQLRKQAEHYHKQYNMKYKGMLLAAKYHIDTLEKIWYNEYGLGQLLPNTYEKLKRQYEEHQWLKNKLSDSNIDGEERIVVARKQPIRRKMLELE